MHTTIFSNGKTVQSTQEQRSTVTSVASRSPGVLSWKNVFQFWGAVEQQEKSSNNGRPSTKRQLSSESTQTIRVVKKEESGSVVQKEVYSEVHGLKTQEGEKGTVFTRTSPVKRKLRRDLFSEPKIFGRVDSHVLSISKQLKAEGVYLSRIVHCVTQGAQSELERVRAIWIWLCHNIQYDVSGYLGLSEKMCSPDQVIQAGKGMCCGYSRICLEMCREVGIKCMEVSGYGKGIGYRLGQSYQNKKSNHMWNAVQLGGHWYLLDSCWGAGTVDIESMTFIQRPEDFIDSHCPDDPQWQLMNSTVSLAQFQQRVFKTSAFYRLGLSIISPKEFHMQTVNGEAMVSMRSANAAEFTYQISQLSGGAAKDLSSSFGLLTVSRQGMTLKLVECSEPKSLEKLPENPFLSWGLHQTAKELGLRECSQGAETIVVDTGSFELILWTTRPLTVLCELVHKELDPTLSKRCVVSQIEQNKLTCRVLCPFRGYYRLSVFVRDFEGESSLQNSGNFLLKCTGPTINLNELFPPALSTSCGPGIKAQKLGISNPSHAAPIITTQQGKCNITFHNSQDLEFTAVLEKEHNKITKHPLDRHVLFTYMDSKVMVSVCLPEAGIYKLGLREDSFQQRLHPCL
ncbi:Kyphoscoliosis peptidase [Acipenser ruthenus]|uniref:Kyphoscoliosis peptidase n=1 Tax=Acipenser ruthenus TaxID=7906 RepID=A0A444U2N7_ACIRT|nr:Kyphoscoliosis peptidase [Acipenser ruthenus]